ncbi:MAG: aminotransferase class I/II-fold pyridoxal phosphate-dependent enzyme [Bacillota bacterium]
MVENFYMAAGEAKGKSFVDPVFSVLAAAREAIAQYGREQVVNASIGSIYDDQEKLATFSTVVDLLRSLSAEDMFDYAPIKGVAGFDQAAMDFTFGESKPESYFGAIATPGGTGGIRNIFYNYAATGEKILIPDWFWGSYSLIASEYGRKIENYSLFTDENTFNFGSLQEKVKECLLSQDNLVVVFNTPAHNPTGYSMSVSDWEKTLDLFREEAKDVNKRITLLLDIAYMDYAGDPSEVRKIFSLFSDLPQNLLITITFSMSKSFLVYGLRCGSLIGISSSKKVIDEFIAVNSYSSRANWSNVARLPQQLLIEIMHNPRLIKELEVERAKYRDLMAGRAAIFVQEAKGLGLEICPYSAGFFTSVPMDNSKEVALRLQQKGIFAVPLKKGLRVAVCSVPTHKMSGLAGQIKNAL